MRNIWQKFKGLFGQAWSGLTVAGRIIAGIIIIGLLGFIIYAATNDSSKDNQDDKAPEIAQVYEPSIGSPLPADSNSSGAVSGASTTEPSEAQNNSPSNEMKEDSKVAPPTGINPADPIKYESSKFGFSAVLPAHSNVEEADSQIRFTSQDGKLQYIVSVNETGTDTLNSIKSQLSNSQAVNNITQIKFVGMDALQFSVEQYGTGVVFLLNGKTYYLLGSQTYFSSFQRI